MEKLKELLGTKYVYNDYVLDLTRILDNVKEIDLADCKFGPNAVEVLRKYYGRVLFVNSTDPNLNQILLHNNGIKVADTRELESLSLDFNSVDELLALLKSLDSKGAYQIKQSSISQPKRIATITLMTLLMPSITLDIGLDVKDVFSFARTEWLKTNKHHDEYWLVSGTSLLKVKVENNTVRLLDGSLMKESNFVKNHMAMPVEFGTEVLIKDEEFNLIFTKCLQVLDARHEAEHRMLDFLERRF
ncbi:MAG: hypothetical protein IJE43_19460 [Alphaproteobacteria bacterium]|nr:hypothetical protein [Alphaproteobacteria bacterium]